MSADIGGKAAIRLCGVAASYGLRPVIEGLDLDVGRGLTTGVIGPNGSGKSTLLKTAAGLLKPSCGSVVVNGMDMARRSAAQRARLVAFMPQDTVPTPLSVEELVAFGRYARRGMLRGLGEDDRIAVESAIAACGIEELRSRPVRSLSGGQRQQAYIAMALAQQAACMLFDEPTSALDVAASHRMLELICSVESVPGQTKLVVLHDIDLALRYCDRIVLMDAGRVVQEGTPAEVFEGGRLEEVFGVDAIRHQTGHGPAWSFFPRTADER